MKNSHSIRLKIISIINFIFFTLAVILISQNPITKYEMSIYNVPTLIWLLLIFVIANGIGIVVHSILGSKERKSWWKIGFILILLVNLIIVLYPLIRGYAFSDTSDHLSHVGYVKDILQTGKVAQSNVYPITHILASQLLLITNIHLNTIVELMGPLFYLALILYTYNLSREILPEFASIFATIASTVIFAYYYIEIFPMGFAFITLPFILYFYFKRLNEKSVNLGICLIILLLLPPFFHPVFSFFLIMILIILEISKFIFLKLYIQKKRSIHSFFESQIITLRLVLISTIILLLWIWNKFPVWESAVHNVVSWFHFEIQTEPFIGRAQEGFDKLGLSYFEIIKLFVLGYGHLFIFLVLSMITIITLIKNKLHLSMEKTRNIFMYVCIYVPIVFFWITDYFQPLTSLSSGRMKWFVIPLFPSIVGFGLFKMMEWQNSDIIRKITHNDIYKSKFTIFIILSLILLICSLIGIFNIYPSPSLYNSNRAATNMEISGVNWLLEERNTSIQISTGGISPLFRYAHASFGTVKSNYLKSDVSIMAHFNYTEYDAIGESFNEKRYVIIRNKYLLMIYTELYPQIGRFNENDFIKLERDPSVNKLYENSEVQVWYVK